MISEQIVKRERDTERQRDRGRVRSEGRREGRRQRQKEETVKEKAEKEVKGNATLKYSADIELSPTPDNLIHPKRSPLYLGLTLINIKGPPHFLSTPSLQIPSQR